MMDNNVDVKENFDAHEENKYISHGNLFNDSPYQLDIKAVDESVEFARLDDSFSGQILDSSMKDKINSKDLLPKKTNKENQWDKYTPSVKNWGGNCFEITKPQLNYRGNLTSRDLRGGIKVNINEDNIPFNMSTQAVDVLNGLEPVVARGIVPSCN